MSLDVTLNHKLDQFELDLAFTLPAKGLTALFGPSGAGKSLTINAIAGLNQPQTGHISLGDKDILDTARGFSLPTHKRRIGYVFQDSRLFPHLNVEKNLIFGAKRTKIKPTKDEIDSLISLLDIGHLLSRYPANLSGGEKQRIALGRAILSNPLFLLLDEPLAALDHRRKEEILPLIERLRDESEIPILYVSHSIDEVTWLADHMILLNHGRIAAEGNIHDIMNRLDLYPLTGRFEAGTVFEARIVAHDTTEGMTHLAFDGGTIKLAQMRGNVGEAVRLRIRARDVMLARSEPKDISANNILPVKITDYRADSNSHIDIQLLCGSTKLMARITQTSWSRMALGKDQNLFAIVKSVSMDRRFSKPDVK